MNKLSWLLYAADVMGGLKMSLALLGGLGLVAFLAVAVIRWIAWYSPRPDGWSHEKETQEQYDNRVPKPVTKWGYILLPVLALLISSAVPERSTVYMIAASELGERVAQTDDAREIIGDLKAKLKDILKVEKK